MAKQTSIDKVRVTYTGPYEMRPRGVFNYLGTNVRWLVEKDQATGELVVITEEIERDLAEFICNGTELYWIANENDYSDEEKLSELSVKKLISIATEQLGIKSADKITPKQNLVAEIIEVAKVLDVDINQLLPV